MKKTFYTSLFLIAFFCQSAYSQYTDVINSNRPGESFGAFSVGKTIFQTEGGLSYINEKHDNTDAKIDGVFVDLDIRYGFWKEELEFIADLQYRDDCYSVSDIKNSRSNLKHTILGFKYLIYDPFKNYEEKPNIYSWKENHRFKWRQFIPAVAVYAGANINIGDNPFIHKDESNISPKAMVALQNHFTGGWVVVTNIIVDKIASDFMTYGGILTATKSFDEKWSGFAEFQGYKSDFHKDLIFRGGAAYLLNENVQLDISVGKNFHDTRNVIYGGIGASWRFTLNYKDVVLFKVAEDKDSKNSGNDKNKDTETNGTVQDGPTE